MDADALLQLGVASVAPKHAELPAQRPYPSAEEELGLKDRHTFNELLDGGEGIARNILADRLKKLEGAGVVSRRLHESDGRSHVYFLTERGKDLLPLLVEMILWGAAHDGSTTVPRAWVRETRRDRLGRLARLRSGA